MLSKSCLSTIRQTYPTLTVVERRVADYILENGEEVVLMPIADLAKNVGVAKSAVVRCAKSLGFEGYAELKIALTDLVRMKRRPRCVMHRGRLLYKSPVYRTCVPVYCV